MVEVLVNEDDPVKAQLVDDRIQALITEANLMLSQQISEQAATYLDLLLEGGEFSVFGQTIDVLGLERAGEILERTARAGRREADQRAQLERGDPTSPSSPARTSTSRSRCSARSPSRSRSRSRSSRATPPPLDTVRDRGRRDASR